MNDKRILMIEDDRDTARLMEMLLRANGYAVAVASDLYTAVNEAEEDKPDLILLDIGLPAVDGFTVIQTLRSMPDLSDVPFIVVSGRERDTTAEHAVKAGASAYFRKPVANTDLLLAIRGALGW